MGSDNSDEDKRDRVLAPDDLDITNQPEVEEIDDGRYVVSPNGPAKKPDRELLENPDWLDSDDDEETAPQPSRTDSPQPDRSSQPARSQRDQPTGSQRSPQPDQSTSTQQPQSDDGPTRQSTPSGQSDGRNQQSTPDRSTDRSQQAGAGNQSTDRSQQAGAGNQSGGRSQQPSSSDQSGGATPQPSSSELAAHDQPPVEPPAVELTNETVSKFLAEELTQSSGDYGFDATLNVEGQVNRGRMTSDDVGETLETLLRWYARQTTDEVEPETVLGIILAGSDLAVEYPVQSAYTMVKQHGLTPDDSIGDLLAAVRNDGSFTVPPSKD